VSRQGTAFDYNSPAELYLSRRRGRHTDYRRFATAAEAIHYAVVELRTRRSLSAWIDLIAWARTGSPPVIATCIISIAQQASPNCILAEKKRGEQFPSRAGAALRSGRPVKAG
jgi:hypothetical protein